MAKTGPLEVLEALGGCLIVLGLVFWSLPLALIVAGLFLVAVANTPGAGPLPTSKPSARAGAGGTEAAR